MSYKIINAQTPENKYLKVDASKVFHGTNLAMDRRFKPDYSPVDMIKMGIFGGAYFGLCDRGTTRPEDWERIDKLPFEIKQVLKSKWLEGRLSDIEKGPNNMYGVKCGKNRRWWMDRLLISDLDPLGWFEWFCHYYYGRRHEVEDRRQINRWINYRARQLGMTRYHMREGHNLDKMKQILLHWSIDYLHAGAL